MIEREAPDLHITAGERPKIRIDGDITNSRIETVLAPKDTLQLAYSVLTEQQKKRFETEDELDFSFGIQNLARFRGNCFKQRGCVSIVNGRATSSRWKTRSSSSTGTSPASSTSARWAPTRSRSRTRSSTRSART